MDKRPCTEAIDKLFLELSQFTNAKTAKEIDYQEKYGELIMAVCNKYPNETRHETALRYIQQAEMSSDCATKKDVGI
ncbi:MAG: hypothetical protein PF495_17305 [Spirochaetales bacterium]|jgi:collagenase-like PrtC family protease|nr:hypothetical protein [Spirochaetales bacterium]